MSPKVHETSVTLSPETKATSKAYRFVDSITCTYIMSVSAASIAEVVTYPLDLTKTRLQIQGEAATTKGQHLKYRGMMATALGIAREEGPLKLWQGVSPAIARHVIYSGFRICTYDYLRKEIAKGYGPNEVVPVWKSSLCGMFAGCCGQWLASPTDLVKVQWQMEGRRRLLGEAPRIVGPLDAFQKILSKGGITGLWKGSVPNVYRAAFVNLGDLTAYDTIKQTLMKKLHMPDGKPVHILSSFGAGLVGAIMATPADVIKTRIMNQPIDEHGRGILYKGPVDCFRQTVKHEGLAALYKGLIPCWMRMAPWSLAFWLSFEQTRKLIGAPIGLHYKGIIDCFYKTVEGEGFMSLYKGFLPMSYRLGPWAVAFWVSFEQIRKSAGTATF